MKKHPRFSSKSKLYLPRQKEARGKSSLLIRENFGCRKAPCGRSSVAYVKNTLEKALPKKEGAREISLPISLISCSLIFRQCLAWTRPSRSQRTVGHIATVHRV